LSNWLLTYLYWHGFSEQCYKLCLQGVDTVEEEKKASKKVQKKIAKRVVGLKLDPHLEEQFASGRLYACISSRPGQCGRADGYVLEGKELEFYQKKIHKKKGKGAAA
jgi:small subunit ribosomal protein S8e